MKLSSIITKYGFEDVQYKINDYAQEPGDTTDVSGYKKVRKHAGGLVH